MKVSGIATVPGPSVAICEWPGIPSESAASSSVQVLAREIPKSAIDRESLCGMKTKEE